MYRRIASAMLAVALGAPLYAQKAAAPPFESAVKRTDVPSRRQAEKLRRRIDYIPASSLVGALRGTGGVIGKTVQTSGDDRTNFQLVRRWEGGSPEVHARWDDLLIIRSGAGTLVTGDSLVGSKYLAPGERRGGHFSTQYEIPLKAGDVVRIPATVPHAVTVSSSEPLEYLLIKQRRQELPIRWFQAP
jgi:mannose-6-phosphate isomerase-like protein (cupin superfamily)